MNTRRGIGVHRRTRISAPGGGRLAAIAVAVVVLAVSGCSWTTPGPSTPGQRPTFSGTVSEYVRVLADCLNKAGVNASVETGPDGRARADFPATSREELERNREVIDDCKARLPAQPSPKTDADFKLMYDHLVAQSRCIKNEGYEVPQVPSWQSFLDAVRADRLEWEPVSLVPDTLMDSLRKKCVDAESWW